LFLTQIASLTGRAQPIRARILNTETLSEAETLRGKAHTTIGKQRVIIVKPASFAVLTSIANLTDFA
jgi:hypothetical protein